MSHAESEQPSAETDDAETITYDELISQLETWEIEPPDLAFHPRTGEIFVLLAEYDLPAGELPVEEGGVLTEWVDCPPEDDVYEAVSALDLYDTTGVWRDVESIRDGIRHDRLIARAVPDSIIVPLDEQLAEYIEDGRLVP